MMNRLEFLKEGIEILKNLPDDQLIFFLDDCTREQKIAIASHLVNDAEELMNKIYEEL